MYVAGALLLAQYDYLPEPPKIAAALEADSTRISAGAYVAAASVFFLLWFAGSLRSFLRSYEGGAGRMSSIAFAGGIAFAAMVLLPSTVMFVAAQRAGQEGGIDLDIAALAYDLFGSVAGNGLPIVLAALVAATGVVSIRTQALPTWFGWVSGALAIGLLTPVNWVLVALIVPWIVVVSVWIYLKAPSSRADG